MASPVKNRSLFDTSILRQAIVDSFGKLTVRRQVRNPVMFVVYVGSVLTTLLWAQAVVGHGEAPAWFIFWVSVWYLFSDAGWTSGGIPGLVAFSSGLNARP